MTIHELSSRIDLPVPKIRKLVERKILPPPEGIATAARYSAKHIAAYHAYLALKHNNVRIIDAVAFCQESGETLYDYVSRRETSIRLHGLGTG